MPVSSVQFGQAPWKYANGLKLSNDGTAPDTIINCATGSIMDSTGVYQIEVGTALSADVSTAGLNGLDTGTFAASKVYAVHVIADPVTQQADGLMVSLSATAPLMPFGYSAFALVGYLVSDSAADILLGYWTGGNGSQRSFKYDAPIATAVTAGASATYAAVALTTFVPAVEDTPVSIAYAFTNNAASDVLNFTPGNGTGDAVTITGQVAGVVLSDNVTVLSKVTTAVPEIDYKISAGTVAVNVAGFDFFI